MKFSALGISLLLFAQATLAQQKPPIGIADIFTWPCIPDSIQTSISNNGQYVLYPTRNIPAGTDAMVLQSLNTKQTITFPGVTHAVFANNNQQAFLLLPGDSLCRLELPGLASTYTTGISAFKRFMQGEREWLACKMNDKDQTLLLQPVDSGNAIQLKHADTCFLATAAPYLIVKTTAHNGNERLAALQCLNLQTGNTKKIWEGKNVGSIQFSDPGSQLVFTADDETKKQRLYSYNIPQDQLNELQYATPPEITGALITNIISFNANDQQLLVKLLLPRPDKIPAFIVPMTIWSTSDPRLQSQQLKELTNGKLSVLALINAKKNTLQLLQDKDETATIVQHNYNNSLLLTSTKGDPNEIYWNNNAAIHTYLVQNGNRVPIALAGPLMSPGGKYVTGHKNNAACGGDIYVFNIATGAIKNVTANMPIPLHNEEADIISARMGRGLELAGWLSGDQSLLVYDSYDIWQIDPAGINAPRNLTNGRSTKMQFRLAEEDQYKGKAIPSNGTLLLTAFNKITKQSGFFELHLSKHQPPALLSLGNYAYKDFIIPDNTSGNMLYQSPFLKARDNNVYLVKREQYDQSPNLFYTHDFKTFTPLSDVHPEKKFNWLSAELLNFSATDGTPTQGVLYKPENFDPGRKYPLIVHYYGIKSGQLNIYQHPVTNNGAELDIAWFVSQGYLVLLTDIHFRIGEPGESALKAVTGAVRYISQRPYVDSLHIGIQGCGFGGYETNYLVTHTSLFAAAVSAAGIADITSDYGNLWADGRSRQAYWEIGNGRLGATPWNNTAVFVDNSPVYAVGQITTPVLMMHNRKDEIVHFDQGVQFFTALRRAGKRSWMLEYDNGEHGVYGIDYKDYLLRMTQFFNHYLKGTAAPVWMTRGIPAAMKGFDDGFQLDNEIKTPGEGLLIDPAGKN